MQRVIGLVLGLALVGAGPALGAGSVERGDYLVNSISGCGSCHTPFGAQGLDMSRALAGRLVEESPAYTAIAPNLTPGGPVADWSDAELARAIREGIRPDGSVLGPPMPFEVYHGISDDDLASIVMYLRTVPAVDNDPGVSTYKIPLPPAWGPPVTSVAAVPEGVTVAYGEYLAGPLGHCVVCHTPFGEAGPMLDKYLGAGGQQFEGPNGPVVAPNITPVGLAAYSDDELKTMITKGVRPNGNPMSPPMPYGFFANLKADDLEAIILYLRALPPMQAP
jgi:mono/diheme cytochrome c family protein